MLSIRGEGGGELVSGSNYMYERSSNVITTFGGGGGGEVATLRNSRYDVQDSWQMDNFPYLPKYRQRH